ncbi:MAG: AAA domain-containing protein [Lachnospiraceae bacterium]|jgi:hypothetical protein|nr:AAA domain-containing protein [Lachnospiraceae bacterium]
MNIQEAYEEICHSITAYMAKNEAGLYRLPMEHRRPLLLMGAPGIGKTAVVKQAASKCQVAFLSYAMTHHTRQSAIGLPVIRERSFQGTPYSITEYTMSEIVGDILHAMEKTGLDEGVLFLDEINCVSETLLPSMLRLLQFKSFGSHRLPDGWIIVAAGNPPGRYNRSARELDIVTLDRVRLLSLEPDLAAWRSYALRQTVHGAILSYLSLKPEHFYICRRREGGNEFVTPRSWEDLSTALETYEALSLPVDGHLFPQFLQCSEVSEGFSSYYRLYRKLSETPGLDGLITSGQIPAAFPSLKDAPADEKLCLAEYLVQNIHRQLQTWDDERLLSESLDYFMDGLDACRPDLPGLETACADLLARRALALQKKKEFGLLSPREELREQLLADQVKALASEARLSGLHADTCAVSVMRSLSRNIHSRVQREALRLEAVFHGIGLFIPEVFGHDLTTCLFFTELLEHPETKAFLMERMQETYHRFTEFI